MLMRPVHLCATVALLFFTVTFGVPLGTPLGAQSVPPVPPFPPGGVNPGGNGGSEYFPDPPLIPVIFNGLYKEFAVEPTLGVAQQVIAGDFDGDTLSDLWLLHGGTLELLTSVDILAIGHTVTIQASAAVAVRRWNSDRDELIWSGAGGLNLSTFEDDGSLTTRFLGHPEWDGATELKLCSLGGTAARDLVGLAPNGSILVLLDVLTVASLGWSFQTSGAPRELEVLNWDAKGHQEVAVRTSEGVIVHDPLTGHALARGGNRTDVGAMAVGRHPIFGDVLFWVTRDFAGTAEILVIASKTLGPIFKTIRYLDGPHDPGIGSITAADLDGDDIPELAMRCGHDGKVLLLKSGHQDLYPDVAVDTLEPYYQELDGFPGDGNQGEVLFTDLDRDGDLDLVWNCEDGESMRLITCREINEIRYAPMFERIFFDEHVTDGHKFIRILFLNAEEVDPEPGLKLQGMLFRKQDALARFDSATPVATVSYPYKQGGGFGASPIDQIPISVPADVADNMIRYPFDDYIPRPSWETPYPAWEIPLIETEWVFPAVYWLMVRYIRTERGSHGDQVVESYPAQAFYFTAEGVDELGTGGSLDILLSQKDWTNFTLAGPVHPPNQEDELSSAPTVIDGGKGGDKELPKDADPGFKGS